MNSLINNEFFSYLNRHLTGIRLLSNKIKKISISYELSEAFSNHSCRFIIFEDIDNLSSLSDEEIQTANNFLHNSFYSTGSGFVSFIYKRQRDYNIDFKVIREFILHYQFAENLFEGFIKDFLPEDCRIDILSLWEEPLFNYSIDFLNQLEYENINSRKDYEKKMHRSFEFDIQYHKRMTDLAQNYNKIENSISDSEISKYTDSKIEDIRRLIIKESIPFNIESYSNTIDNIFIDILKLKKTLANFIPSSFEKIDSKGILDLIDKKENDSKKLEALLKNLISESNLQLGIFILVELNSWGDKCNDIGLVKKFKINHNNELEVIYNNLKTNLKESKVPLKSTNLENISYFVYETEIAEDKLVALNKKDLQVGLFKRIGIRNIKYKNKCR